jgi:polyisoprenoid-binding protein YceI
METPIGTVAPPTSSTTTDLPLKPGQWVVDKVHSRVGFSVRHLGVAKVRGYFADVDAELVVGPSLDDTAVSASIDMASIDTGNADRDAHVRSSDVLHVERRLTMTFRSTGISGAGGDWTLDGDLTIGEMTRPMSLAVEFGGVADYFDGTRHAGFEARGELRRKDFGLSFGPADPLVGQVVKLEFDLEFIEPA